MAGPLDAAAVHALLAGAGFPVADQGIATTAEAAEREAARIGYPVALKATAPGLLHRGQAHGVRLNIDSAAALLEAAAELRATVEDIDGFMVQPMSPRGLEMVLGFRRDPLLGPVVMTGVGGELVEAIGDVAFRLAPVSQADAREMVAGLRLSSVPALRKRFGAELGRLCNLITTVSAFAVEHPDVLELDLNPVILTAGSAVIVDAKVILGDRVGPLIAAGQVDVPSSAELSRLLTPRSIAVIGASANQRKQGGRLFHYLVKHGFAGALYPVNPHESEILGRRCFRSVDELPDVPDLACIVVSAGGVEEVVAACGRRGIPAAAIFTSGFGETGVEGMRRQDAIVKVARTHGMRICGPNTAGLMNETARVCAAIGMAFEVESIPAGSVAMISQSGAIGSALLSRAWDQGLAVGRWVCTGNEADLTLGDYMIALVEDPGCSVIAIFMETLRDPRPFVSACAEARRAGKSVVVYKSGNSPAGRRAMQTHTGAIAGPDEVYDALFRSCGVIRVPDLQSLLDCSSALASLPLPAGDRVAVVSASGGACSVVADECARRSVPLAELSEATTRSIASLIPTFGVATNPVDVTMDVTVRPTMIADVARAVLQDPGVDALLVMLTTNADPPAAEVAQGLIEMVGTATKPVVIARLGAGFLAPRAMSMYREAHITVHPMPEPAVSVLRAMADAARVAARPAAHVEVVHELPA
jgi:acyl-CoA synthetase (NDP forming)